MTIRNQLSTGSTWTLVTLGTNPGLAYDSALSPVTLAFDEQGRVAGRAGCNRYMGSYTLDGSALQIGPLALTRMLCPPPAMEIEHAYVRALQTARRIEASADDLIIQCDGGTLHFKAHRPG